MQNVMQGIMADPMFHMGMGILGSGGRYGSLGHQLGQGSMAGILSYQNAVKAQQQQLANQLAIQQARQQQAAQQQLLGGMSQQERLMAQAYPNQWAKSRFQSPPSDYRSYLLAQKQGYPGTFMDYQRELKAAGKDSLTVKMGNQFRAAGDQAALDYTTGYIENVNQQAIEARGQAGVARRNQQLLKAAEEAGVTGSGLRDIAGRMASFVGLPEGAPYQQIQTAYGDRILSNLSQLKGALSEKELAFISDISPGTQKSSETNYILTEMEYRAAVRNQQKAKLLGEYLNQNNGRAYGFDQWYMDNHDPFGEFDLQQMKDQYRREIKGETQAGIDRERQETQAAQDTVRMFSRSGGMK